MKEKERRKEVRKDGNQLSAPVAVCAFGDPSGDISLIGPLHAV
jgi:hypothetical protein